MQKPILLLVTALAFSCSSLKRREVPHPEERVPANEQRTKIEEANLQSYVAALVNFRNRDACEPSQNSGIRKASRWLLRQYAQNPRLKAQTHEFRMQDCGDSNPRQANVFAKFEGTDLKDEVVVFGGHYDSIAFNASVAAMDKDPGGDYYVIPQSPGANDSGSQSAVLLELARVLSENEFRRTIVFVSFAGEEAGLVGSKAFVRDLAKILPGKRVVAMINFDIVGGDIGVNDEASLQRYRIFAPSASPHLTLASSILEANQAQIPEFHGDLQKRIDRPGRGGDHISFQNAGIPAVRIMEAKENPHHQHCADDLQKFMLSSYMARIVELSRVIADRLAERVR